MSCYLFVARETTWLAAEGNCIRRGATLAKINSQDKNDFLRNYLRSNSRVFSGYDLWVGGKRLQDGSWQWSDGAPLGGVTSSDGGNFSDWDEGKPDAFLNTCLELEADFRYHWNDDFCDELNFYICERPYNPVTPPPLPGHQPTTTTAATTTTATITTTTTTAAAADSMSSQTSSDYGTTSNAPPNDASSSPVIPNHEVDGTSAEQTTKTSVAMTTVATTTGVSINQETLTSSASVENTTAEMPKLDPIG